VLRKNEGPVDRVTRVAAGALLVVAGLFVLDGLQASALGLVAAGFGAWLMATGGVGVCPGYIPIGISTLGTRHGPFGIRLPRRRRPVSPSPSTDVQVVYRRRQDAQR
jgi:hypothetical protein